MAAKEKGTDKQADTGVPATPAAPWAPTVATVANGTASAEVSSEVPAAEAPKDPEATVDVMDGSPEGMNPPTEIVDTGVAVAEPKDEIRAVVGEVIDMVTVTVPKAFNLRLDHFREFKFKAGVQEMERVVAEHWYSKANGVTIYESKKK